MATVLETASVRRATAGRTRTGTAAALLVAAVLVVSALSVLVGSTSVSPTALFDTADPDHAIADHPVGAHLPGPRHRRRRSGWPGPACRGSPATRWPTRASSASTPERRSRWCWRSRSSGSPTCRRTSGSRSREPRSRWSPCTRSRRSGRDGATPVKLAIAGAALTAALSSWTSGVLLTDRATMESFRFWQVGTVGGRSFDVLLTGLPFLALGAVIALGSFRLLNALALGDDVARGLGRHVTRDRLVLGVACVLLAGGATALAGPIAFVGLIVPHGVRAVVGGDYAKVLPFSIGCGAVLVTLADTVGRVVLPPTEVQVGIMTAVVGVPVFLWLIRRGRIGASDAGRDGSRQADRRGSPAAIERVRVARKRPVRRARLVVGGLSVVLLGVFSARVLLGDFTFTDPRLLPDPLRRRDPGRLVHPDGEQAPARRARRAGRHRVRSQRRDLPDHAAEPAGQPGHHRRQHGRKRGRRVRDHHLRPARRLGVGGGDRGSGRRRRWWCASSPGRAPATGWC